MESIGFRQQTYLSGRTDRVQQLAHVSLVDGASNTMLGLNAGAKSTGYRNTYVGANVASSSKTSSNNVVVGANAGEFMRNSYDNVALGRRAAQFMNAGTYNVAVGTQAGERLARSSYNTVVGYKSGGQMISGARNTFVGSLSGYYTFNASDNVFVGESAGKQNRYGHRNTFVGSGAGKASENGNNSVFIGFEAGASVGNADGSTIIGTGAAATASGSYNTLLGSEVAANLHGNTNVAVGYRTAKNAVSSNSVFVGALAGEFANVHEAVAIGYDALCEATGAYVTCIGASALCEATGNNNTVCGSHTWQRAAGDYNTLFGSRFAASDATDQTLVLHGNRVTLQNCVIIGEDVDLDLSTNTQTGQTWWQHANGAWMDFRVQEAVLIGPHIRLRPDDSNSVVMQYGPTLPVGDSKEALKDRANRRFKLAGADAYSTDFYNVFNKLTDISNSLTVTEKGKDYGPAGNEHVIDINTSKTPSGLVEVNVKNATDPTKTGSLLLSFVAKPLDAYIIFSHRSPSMTTLSVRVNASGKLAVLTDDGCSVSYQLCGYQTGGGSSTDQKQKHLTIDVGSAPLGLWLVAASNTTVATPKYGTMLLAFYKTGAASFHVQNMFVHTSGAWVDPMTSNPEDTGIIVNVDYDITVTGLNMVGAGSFLSVTQGGSYYYQVDLTSYTTEMFAVLLSRVGQYSILLLSYNAAAAQLLVVGSHVSPGLTQAPTAGLFISGASRYGRVYVDAPYTGRSWIRIGYPSA